MKKTFAILIAAVLIILSVVPAFAVVSPQPTTANYQIIIIPGPGGGSYDFDYKTPVDDDGTQIIHVSAKPQDGYKFTGWTIEGDFTPLGKLTDAELDLIIRGDIKATPNFVKIGEEGGETKPAAKTDDSSKSPKTGSTSMVYVVIASAALLGLLFVAKKSFYKK